MVIDGLGLILADLTHAFLVVNRCQYLGDVMSSAHHDLDLALKSSIIIVKDGLSPSTKLSKFSKFDKNSSNSTVNWLGDW